MVEAWLDEPYPSDPNQKLSSGFKILVIPLNDEDVLPSGMSRRTIDLIHAALGLPPVYRHGASVSTGADGMFLQPDGTYGKFYCCPNSVHGNLADLYNQQLYIATASAIGQLA
jgi:hypothetical protein